MHKIRLKGELFWSLNEAGIEVYYGNKLLNKNIVTPKKEEMFLFLKFLSIGRTESEIENFNELNKEEKNDIINFLKKKKYIVEDDYERESTRLEYFLNTFPQLNYVDVSQKIANTKILIIGLGTATSYILEILIKLGFKNFMLIDGDSVEENNILAQNYFSDEIGNTKVEALFNRYSKIAKIDYHIEYVKSFYHLTNLINVNSFDFLINGADQLSLMRSLIEAKCNNSLSSVLIESGYGVLEQNVHLISNSEEAEIFKEIIDQMIIDSKEWIVNNNGSILNAIFSVFAISKMILDKLINLDSTNIAFADFLQNRYFIGSRLEETYYEKYTDVISENMVYKKLHLEKRSKWIETINDSNIYTMQVSSSYQSDYDEYQLGFLLKKSNKFDIEKLEFLLDKTMDEKEDPQIENIKIHIIQYIREYYNEDMVILIKNILKFAIFEDRVSNKIEQSTSKKINNQWFIINNKYSNDTEKILNLIHEVFNIINSQVVKSRYELEYQIMRDEIEFLQYNQNITKNNALIYYYFNNKTRQYIDDFTVLNYEKCVILDKLNIFQVDFNFQTKNNINGLIKLLNSKVNLEKPLHNLPIFLAYDRNKALIESLLD